MTFRLLNVGKSFANLPVLSHLNLEIEEHKLACIVGPSGAGKTTLLNLISGVLEPDSGSINGFDGKSVAYLFQETRLLPWKTVEQNIEFVLKDKMSKRKRLEVVSKAIETVGLAAFGGYYPAQLSGGMKQRVAIARAFAYPADLLLMDEPFDGLDPQLKKTVMKAFLNLWQMEKRSVFFVTHDMNEALLLGEEIFVLTDRPARVKGQIHNPVPHCERARSNEALHRVENELNELLTQPKG